MSEDGEIESFPDALCSYLIEAHELGESGTPHIQGYCQLKVGMTLNQMKSFCPTAHFEVARGTPYQNFLYCAKGDQSHAEWTESKEQGPNYGKNASFLEWGVRPKPPINAHKKKPKDDTYEKALAAPTVREGMDIVKTHKARDYCLHGDAIERHLKNAKAPSYASKFLLSDFNQPPLDVSSKAIFLSGVSNSGKTQWALAHFKNPLLVSHMDQLKRLGPDHDGIVFDDMAFNHWPPESVIHLLDMECERALHVRYGTVTIPAYTKKIFTSNKKNIFTAIDVEVEQFNAIERRYKRVDIIRPLFSVDTIFTAQLNAYQQMVGAHRPIPTLSLPPLEPSEPGEMDELD